MVRFWIDVVDTQDSLINAEVTNATFRYHNMCNRTWIPNLDRTARIPELGYLTLVVHHARHNKAAYVKVVKNCTTFFA